MPTHRLLLLLGLLAVLAILLAPGSGPLPMAHRSAPSPAAVRSSSADPATTALSGAAASLAAGGGPANGRPLVCGGGSGSGARSCGSVASAAPVWTPQSPGPPPSGTMIYDHEDHDVVFVTESGITWTYAKGVWNHVVGRTPGAGRYLVMADDRADGYLLLFYGFCGHPCEHTWIFRGGQWIELQPRVSPGVASEPAMAYDPIDGYVVYLDSTRTSGTTCFTWIFVRGEWTNLCPSVSPLPRDSATMVFDAHDGYVLLFGGRGPTSIYSGAKSTLNSSWTFVHGTWSPLTTPVAPPPQENPAMSYDNATGSVLLVNGATGGTVPLRGFWSFSGGIWTNLTDPLPAMTPIQVVYDYSDNALLLTARTCLRTSGYGAASWSCPMLWSFANGSWTNRSAAAFVATGDTLPTAVAMAYDWADHEVLVAGNDPDYCNGCSTTYTYRNGNWSTAAAPNFGTILGMTYDVHDGYVVLWAGSSTWTFRGGLWTLQAPTKSPPALSGTAMSYDNADGYVLLFDNGWTWSYAAGNWTNRSGSITGSPGYRTGPILVNDTTDGYVLLAGGYSGPYLGNRNDTWSYRAGVWTHLNTTGTPPVLRTAVVTDDPADGFVLAAGVSGFNYGTNTWSWQTDRYVNGSWSAVTLGNGVLPDQLAGGGLFDPALGGVLVYLPFGYSPYTSPTDSAFWTFGVPTLYPVTIYGKGLPLSQTWKITAHPEPGPTTVVTGAGTGHRFFLPNGSYTFSASTAGRYVPSATQWAVVVDGSSVSVTLRYLLRYAVSFNETGLPAKTAWSLEVDGSLLTSSTSWINLTLPNGSYGFTVTNLSGHPAVGNGYGYLTVAAGKVRIGVRFL